MIGLAAILGWCLAAALVFELRRRAGLIADAAHELRGPLTAISLGTEALRRQPVSRRRAEALATELLRMEAAADDVSAAARGRRAPARVVRVGLASFLERDVEAWRAGAERRGARITLDWQAGRAATHADPRRLAQAFGNLLANALEHGGGEIVVRGRPWRDGVRVEVEDAGGRETSRPVQSGRGRGLGIATRAARGAGGSLVAFERPGGGRVAAVDLPAIDPGPYDAPR
ncbi:MAG TPA: HAMP domain-containing sensor histidine kinase [Thermoleophilaceae bacterium]|nr:HAMP domain-containing sensor histidine kinase [Thermoleophilaceae bacterium]